jgi:hypothetical protein
MTQGRFADAQREGVAAADATNYFNPIALPLAIRAAMWAGEVDASRTLLKRLEPSANRGHAIALDITALRAGLAALEGRRVDAVAGYREALRGWRRAGLAFDEAMTTLDLARMLVPTEHEMPDARAAIEVARATFERLEATPLLDRLEALPGPSGGAEPPRAANAPVADEPRSNASARSAG